MKKVYLFAAMVSLVLAGCSSKDEVKNPNELYVSVSGIAKSSTRSLVTDASFTSGSAIAVFVTGTGYTPAVTTYTLSGTTWNPNTSIYLTGNQASVYGYYPSTATCTPLSSTGLVSASLFGAPSSGVSTEASFTGASQTDYMWATPKTADNNGNNTVTMTYNHALTRIAFVIKKDANYPTAALSGAIANIRITAATAILPTAGTFVVSNGTFAATTGSNATTLQLTPVGTTYINANGVTTETAYCLVAPTTTALTGIGLTMTIDGKTMTAAGFPAAPTWLSGNSYAYTVTVSPTALIVSSTVTVAAWTVGAGVSSITAQ
jgi:hypothetical protein